ncbi:MAG: transposase [bacterium]
MTSRGNQREDIFFDDRDREKFLEILKRTKDRYSYLLYAYCLMRNHYHLLLETPCSKGDKGDGSLYFWAFLSCRTISY